jgi:hypothetical protein
MQSAGIFVNVTVSDSRLSSSTPGGTEGFFSALRIGLILWNVGYEDQLA